MDTRTQLLEVSRKLFSEQGIEATTTRAVCQAAGVTQPTLYHHFGDRDGLVSAVVEDAFARFVEHKKQVATTDDPVDDLRRSFDNYVAFGVAHPELYAVMYTRRKKSPAGARQASAMLLERVAAVARTGRLKLDLALAAQLTASTAHGVTSLLVTRPEVPWHQDFVATARDTLLGTIARPAAEAAEPVPEGYVRLVAAAHGLTLKEAR